LAEAQIVDHRTRRVLHDDVLPSIHAALLALRRPTTEPGEPAAIQEAAGLLTEAHHQISDLLRDIVPTLKPQIEQMGVLTALRTMVENEFGHAFDKVTWQVDRGSIPLVDALSPVAAEVLFYAAREAIRNAARHARPGGQRHPQSGSGGALHLSLTVAARDGLEITIADNGVGMEPNRSQAAGHGLALHSTMMAIVGGTLTPSSRPGQGTRVTLHIPASALSQRAVHGAPSPTTAVGEEARAN
jgi:signal transduction histidine kinase